MTLEQKLQKLPAYVYCDDEDCPGNKHYLNINRDIRGKYSIGFVEFTDHTAIYTENEFDTIEAAVDAMLEEMEIKI